MAYLEANNVVIRGISACVPKQVEKNLNHPVFGNDDGTAFIASTGVEERRIASDDTCTSDLCFSAAEKLIEDLAWNKDDIECLVFVSQTPDYHLPATSCLLQNRLGLSKECATVDISLGCSGWVYGLSVISSMMSAGKLKKGLLLAGDTPSKIHSKTDKSAWPLFGDAGTVTALEFKENSSGMKFLLNTDGGGYECIVMPDGGYRNPCTPESFEVMEISEGISRNRLQSALNGADVFSFGITKVPKSVKALMEHFSIDKDSIDLFVFHQANKFMNEKIRKKIGIEENKVPYCLEKFGNTSAASIPLTLVVKNQKQLSEKRNALVACGFGVGLSWGSVYFETDKIVVPDLVEV